MLAVFHLLTQIFFIKIFLFRRKNCFCAANVVFDKICFSKNSIRQKMSFGGFVGATAGFG
jgi:hypothetical protein